jgi:hypothetical protein
MIIIGLIFIGQGHGSQVAELPLVKIGFEKFTSMYWRIKSNLSFRGIPGLFGVAIYAFMCHHRYLSEIPFFPTLFVQFTWLCDPDFK